MAFLLVIFTKSKTKCTPTVLPVGTPTIFPWTPHVGLPVDSLVYWESYGTSIGLLVDSQWTPSGLPVWNTSTITAKHDDSQFIPSGLPWDSLGVDWESTWTP